MSRHFKPSIVSKPSGQEPLVASRKRNEANRVRIIGGHWRSRLIEFPDGEGLRPTANRVRETLFNWLGQTLHDRRCLDLFAGSGALGFEAASRGATEVVMVERSRNAILALKQNQARLGAAQCRVVHADAMEFLAANERPFDVIFVDPPFGSGLLASVLPLLERHLTAGAMVYAEWGEPFQHALPGNSNGHWRLQKQGKAGAVHFGLLTIAEGLS